MRRRRRSQGLRQLARETRLLPEDFILPVFVVPGAGREQEISAMPGVCRFSVDRMAEKAVEWRSPAVLVFGVPEAASKDATGSAAWEGELVPSAVRRLKAKRPDLIVITDVCLCGYTTHGHCGPLTESGEVDNDRALEALGRTAVAHASAGADMVAPSAMMDLQVAAIREALDEAWLSGVAVMSYAAKFASAYYGPFREAAHSSPGHGDRRGYQLPPANRREALGDALLDEAEGADWLMVKPALPYLDVLAELRGETRLPLAAYQVSGEYSMLRAAGTVGALDERDAVLESLLSIKRAGADAIITYYAEEAIEWLKT
jgi:porphobilinogen synthase